MNLFDIFKKSYWRTPRIPREIFVEDLYEDDENIETDKNANNMDDPTSKITEMHYQYGIINCRKEIDDFLNRDFDADGYKDALIDSDSSNMKSHSDILKLQLEMKVKNSLTLYENENRNYDVDIKIMTNNGMIDYADKLTAGKAHNLEEIARITMMLTEANAGRGIGHLPLLSYEQGFKRGIAAKLFL